MSTRRSAGTIFWGLTLVAIGGLLQDEQTKARNRAVILAAARGEAGGAPENDI